MALSKKKKILVGVGLVCGLGAAIAMAWLTPSYKEKIHRKPKGPVHNPWMSKPGK